MLFLLQKGSKTFNIVIGGLFVGSLKGFASVKYCSIIYVKYVLNMFHISAHK